jgi:anti-sigma-K factor RskA
MDRDTFLDLIPAYTLGALDDAERVEFEALLADDGDAQTLLAEYQTLADSLVLTTPVRAAPAHLNADLRQRLTGSSPRKRKPVRRWLAAAAAVLVVVFGVIWGLTQVLPTTDSTPVNGEKLYADITALENVVRIAVSPAEQFLDIVGDLVVDPDANRAVIQVNNLPPLQTDQTFQLWLRNSDGIVVDGGLFVGSYDGPTYVTLPLQDPFNDYQGMGVSLEPAGGSPLGNQRSGPSVFRIALGDA